MSILEIAIETCGWVGAVLLLTSYGMNINGKLSSTSLTFMVCNLLSGLFFVINTAYHGAYPSAIVNVVWAGIALVAIIRKKKIV